MATLRIGPGVPTPRPVHRPAVSLGRVVATFVYGLAGGLGIGLGITVWVAVGSLF